MKQTHWFLHKKNSKLVRLFNQSKDISEVITLKCKRFEKIHSNVIVGRTFGKLESYIFKVHFYS